MSDTVKLIIEIPKEDYEFTKGAKTARVYPSEYYVKLILNGIPLDDVKQEIWVTDFDFGDYYDHTAEIQDKVCGILDNIGKAESEVKPNE